MGARPYDHYKDGHVGGGKDGKKSRCTVYGTPEWANNSEAQARQATELALQEYLRENPELAEAARQTSAARNAQLQQLLGTTAKTLPQASVRGFGWCVVQ